MIVWSAIEKEGIAMNYNYGPGQQPAAMPIIQQQIPTFHGRQSAEMIRMAPNCSIIGVDDTAPLAWFCVTDSVGRLTVTPYDVSPHKEPTPMDSNTIETRFSSIESSIAELGSIIKNVEAKLNEQSNARAARSSAKSANKSYADGANEP